VAVVGSLRLTPFKCCYYSRANKYGNSLGGQQWDPLKRFFDVCHTAGDGIAATPNDSSTPGESGTTEETGGSNGAQGN
jgi:hypothetical protein